MTITPSWRLLGTFVTSPQRHQKFRRKIERSRGRSWRSTSMTRFQAYYVVHDSKKATIKELKAALKEADELLLATDEDREGEAISWHLLEVLKPKVPVKRMVFNEITPEAIREAVNRPRELDMRLVEAQETRRVVDRLYGYPVSEVLWKKVGREAKSAGRVQSVAVRLVVDRERERNRFHAGGVLGHRRAVSSRPVPGAVGDSRWGEGRNGVGLRRRRAIVPRGGRTPGRGFGPGLDVGARWTGLHGRLGDAEAFLPKAEGTVHDLNASAGSLRSPSVGCPTDHADRTVPLRERLHHLHANRLHHAV